VRLPRRQVTGALAYAVHFCIDGRNHTTVAGLLWGIIYAHYPPLKVLQTMVSMIVFDFFLVGMAVATLLWAISNRFFTHSSHTHATDQSVEWAYSFDVHVNSFFPLFLNLYLAQLVLSPVITRTNWVCLFFGNTLYLSKPLPIPWQRMPCF